VLKRKPEKDYISNDNPIRIAMEKRILLDPSAPEKLDTIISGIMGKLGKPIIDMTLNGLIKTFPRNNFTAMTKSGAKGSR